MNKNLFVILVLTLVVASCSSVSTGGYYWGKYSYTYHDLVKNPSTDSRAKHQETLRNIISKSNELNLRVPPGIHAELGNLLAFDQQNEAAIAEFNKEMNVYPESKVFIERLLSGITQGGEK
jgi:hypothetical protein